MCLRRLRRKRELGFDIPTEREGTGSGGKQAEEQPAGIAGGGGTGDAASATGAAAAASNIGGSAGEPAACHTEAGAEYDAERVLRWGTDLLTPSPPDCCAACRADPKCNV